MGVGVGVGVGVGGVGVGEEAVVLGRLWRWVLYAGVELWVQCVET